MIGIPRRWTTWTHKETGNRYLLMLVTNIHADKEGWPKTVVYRDDDGLVWSRPLNEWHDRYDLTHDKHID